MSFPWNDETITKYPTMLFEEFTTMADPFPLLTCLDLIKLKNEWDLKFNLDLPNTNIPYLSYDELKQFYEAYRWAIHLTYSKFYHWKTIVSESDELKKLTRKRNIKKQQTKDRYVVSLTTYCVYTNKSLSELISEAKKEQKTLDEDELSIIDLLEEFRPWMSEQGLGELTIRTRFNDVLTLYRNNRIRIPELERYIPDDEVQLEYSDLPAEKDIERAINSSTSLSARALFYFMASSGTGKLETANLTVQDFIDATRDYHGEIDNIENVLLKLEEMENVIPLFKLKRQKTGTTYHTCCTPQATKAILTLLRSKNHINNDDPLFYYKYGGISKAFHRANFKHGWPKIKNYYYFGSHRLRKRHASLLIRDKGLAHYLQGRVLDKTSRSYFFEDPKRVREEYKKYVPLLTIGEAEYYGVSSEEYDELQAENAEIKQKYENLQTCMDEQKAEYEQKIRNLESINVALSNKIDAVESRLDNITRESDIKSIIEYASQNEIVNKHDLMDTVMTLYDADYKAKRVRVIDDNYKQTLVNRALLIKDQLTYNPNSPEIMDERLEITYGKKYTNLKKNVHNVKKQLLKTKYPDLHLTQKNNNDIECELVKYMEKLLEDKDYPTEDAIERIIFDTLRIFDDVELVEDFEYVAHKERMQSEAEELEKLQDIEDERYGLDK